MCFSLCRYNQMPNKGCLIVGDICFQVMGAWPETTTIVAREKWKARVDASKNLRYLSCHYQLAQADCEHCSEIGDRRQVWVCKISGRRCFSKISDLVEESWYLSPACNGRYLLKVASFSCTVYHRQQIYSW